MWHWNGFCQWLNLRLKRIQRSQSLLMQCLAWNSCRNQIPSSKIVRRRWRSLKLRFVCVLSWYIWYFFAFCLPLNLILTKRHKLDSTCDCNSYYMGIWTSPSRRGHAYDDIHMALCFHQRFTHIRQTTSHLSPDRPRRLERENMLTLKNRAGTDRKFSVLTTYTNMNQALITQYQLLSGDEYVLSTRYSELQTVNKLDRTLCYFALCWQS